jgi:hypothetical protein
LRRHARSVTAALVLLLCNAAAWADNYDPSNRKLTIPYLTVGGATYSNVVVTVGGVISGPTGTSASGSGDVYDPANRKLIIPRVMVGTNPYYNVVGTVSGLVAIGSVPGADNYDGDLPRGFAVLQAHSKIPRIGRARGRDARGAQSARQIASAAHSINEAGHLHGKT